MNHKDRKRGEAEDAEALISGDDAKSFEAVLRDYQTPRHLSYLST